MLTIVKASTDGMFDALMLQITSSQPGQSITPTQVIVSDNMISHRQPDRRSRTCTRSGCSATTPSRAICRRSSTHCSQCSRSRTSSRTRSPTGSS
jgi:hypothetical protein